ncbi:hypothetical protein HK105_203869 [Polyrhizophydium stewartii]|uniref:BLOC-1-related complex subunit 7 n=1 Tax=Polyrhizophydium stewartii TaxID=2732419 RepID=A0ABR4NAD0_9FUNG
MSGTQGILSVLSLQPVRGLAAAPGAAAAAHILGDRAVQAGGQAPPLPPREPASASRPLPPPPSPETPKTQKQQQQQKQQQKQTTATPQTLKPLPPTPTAASASTDPLHASKADLAARAADALDHLSQTGRAVVRASGAGEALARASRTTAAHDDTLDRAAAALDRANAGLLDVLRRSVETHNLLVVAVRDPCKNLVAAAGIAGPPAAASVAQDRRSAARSRSSMDAALRPR